MLTRVKRMHAFVQVIAQIGDAKRKLRRITEAHQELSSYKNVIRPRVLQRAFTQIAIRTIGRRGSRQVRQITHSRHVIVATIRVFLRITHGPVTSCRMSERTRHNRLAYIVSRIDIYDRSIASVHDKAHCIRHHVFTAEKIGHREHTSAHTPNEAAYGYDFGLVISGSDVADYGHGENAHYIERGQYIADFGCGQIVLSLQRGQNRRHIPAEDHLCEY